MNKLIIILLIFNLSLSGALKTNNCATVEITKQETLYSIQEAIKSIANRYTIDLGNLDKNLEGNEINKLFYVAVEAANKSIGDFSDILCAHLQSIRLKRTRESEENISNYTPEFQNKLKEYCNGLNNEKIEDELIQVLKLTAQKLIARQPEVFEKYSQIIRSLDNYTFETRKEMLLNCLFELSWQLQYIDQRNSQEILLEYLMQSWAEVCPLNK